MQGVAFEGVEIVVAKNGPPFAFAKGVLGSAFAPGFGDVPVSGLRGGGALILWSDGAARGEKKRESNGGR